MTRTIDRSNCFILEAFDRTLWCAIAQAPLRVTDIEVLRAILGLAADEDPKLEFIYGLDDAEITTIVSTFDTFDPRQIHADLIVTISRWSGLYEIPYLVHTNYELPLLLDGRKKLAHMYGEYPPATFWGEERFDHWVAEGALHREEVLKPFEKPIRDFLGFRSVYYTPKGEEWRIPAHKLIRKASEKAGGWNEHFERLEGMLLGYEDWQNDWWIKTCLERGAFGAATYCCVVTSAGLAWTESSGLRALPPIETSLPVRTYPGSSEADLQEFMREHPDGVAVLRFSVDHHAVQHIIDHWYGAWQVPGQQIPELNKNLKGGMAVVARRGQSA
jgi:hypothetical protein